MALSVQSVLIIILLSGACSAIRLSPYKDKKDAVRTSSLISENEKTQQRSIKRFANPITIEAFFINLEESPGRLNCMASQLNQLAVDLAKYNVVLKFSRHPGVRITSEHERSALRDPELIDCFPHGSSGVLRHGHHNEEEWRGVLGNTCAHIRLITQLAQRTAHPDYYMIFEDDVIMDQQKIADKLLSLFSNYHPGWTLIAMDTFSFGWSDKDSSFTKLLYDPPSKSRVDGKELDLYNIDSQWGYWGAHAWIMQSHRVSQFLAHMGSHPTVTADWYPKLASPNHITFMAYQTGSVKQRQYVNKDEELYSACHNVEISDIARAKAFTGPTSSLSQVDSDSNQTTDEVVVLGMYNTGTKLFYDMFHKSVEKPNQVELCKKYTAGAYCGGVWKHTHPARLAETMRLRPEYGDFSKATAVVLVRHPFSLIHSLQHGEGREAHCGNYTIQSPCEYVSPKSTKMLGERISRPICPHESGECWHTMAQAWNSYARNYLDTLPQLFQDVEIIRYEDLVEHPQHTLHHLVKKMNMGLHENMESLEWHANDIEFHKSSRHKPASRKHELKTLYESDYGTGYSYAQKNELCKRLDKHLMYRLGYKGCHNSTSEARMAKVSMTPGRENLCMTDEKGTDHVVPEFFLVGAQKAASSTFYAAFTNHEEVHKPILEPDEPEYAQKELHYFGEPTGHWQDKHGSVLPGQSHWENGKDWWLSRMPKCHQEERQVVGDFTPNYLYDETAPINIKKTYGDLAERLQFGIILRNPLDRILSAYAHFKHPHLANFQEYAEKLMDDKAETHTDYLLVSNYSQQLDLWFSTFDPAQFNVITFHDFVDHSLPNGENQVIKQVWKKLDLREQGAYLPEHKINVHAHKPIEEELTADTLKKLKRFLAKRLPPENVAKTLVKYQVRPHAYKGKMDAHEMVKWLENMW